MFKKLWDAVKKFFGQLWMLVSDYEKDFDPWKLAGFALLVLCAIGATKVFALVGKINDTELGILSGLIGSGITVATFLFGQSRKSDAAMMDKASK